MRIKQIRISIIVGIIGLLLILLIQGYNLYNIWRFNTDKIDQSIWLCLKETASNLNELHNCTPNDINPVQQANSNCYMVDVGCDYSETNLVHSLKTHLNKHNLNLEFKLATYNCSLNELKYLGYYNTHSLQIDSVLTDSIAQWPAPDIDVQNNTEYYFCILFYGKDTLLLHQMQLWLIMAALSFLVIAFFSYTMFAFFKQKHLSELQKDFINNMTHEFKTPISSINIAADVLGGFKEAPQRFSTYAKLIKKENNRLNKLVEQVLNIARIDKGNNLYRKENFHAHELINEILQNKPFTQNASIKTQFNAGKPIIFGDKMHFSNIILNLIDNGIKYNNAEIAITISTKQLGKSIIIDVEDNGIGMDKKYAKKIFQRFYRIPTGNIHDVKGFGLGLYYVNQIVKNMGWKINCQSVLGKGSIFSLVIPTSKSKNN
jgi:two-component system phosphate regulon sensor histidine kinase PhoR